MADSGAAARLVGTAKTQVDGVSGFATKTSGRFANPMILVAARPFKPTTFVNLDGYTFQRVYTIKGSPRQIALVFDNMAQAGSPNENAAGPYTLKCEVIFGSTGGGTGVPVVATFNGAVSATNPAYNTLISDPITVPGFVADGDLIVVRSFVNMAGAYLPVDVTCQPTAGTALINEGYLLGDYVGSQGAGNNANSFGGANATNGFGPSLIIGSCATDPTTLYVAGDSIPSGSGWIGVVPGTYNGPGYVNYFSQTQGVPVYNAGRSGETIATAVAKTATGGTQQRLQKARYAKNALVTYGTNDLGVSSLATIKANLLTYWSWLARMGMRVFQGTYLPKPTSSDQFQTVAGQTVTAAEADRIALNQYLRAPASAGAGNSALYDSGGALYAVLDTALSSEVNADGSSITINPNTGAISNGTGGRWIIDPTVYDSGTATSWTNSQTLNVTGKNWTVNQWWGYSLYIVSDPVTPAAVGQCQQIQANSANQIITSAFTTLPSSSATYRIIRQPTPDGVHPSPWRHMSMADALTAAKSAGLFL